MERLCQAGWRNPPSSDGTPLLICTPVSNGGLGWCRNALPKASSGSPEREQWLVPGVPAGDVQPAPLHLSLYGTGVSTSPCPLSPVGHPAGSRQEKKEFSVQRVTGP